MYSTTYHRPSSVEEAASLFAKGKEAKYLAGGHTLLPVMKQRLASPSDVIDLARIPALVGIDVTGDTVTVKAATTYYDIMSATRRCRRRCRRCRSMASVIGDPAVRYRGTIGGSIANNDPAADLPAAVLALGATVKTNKRTIAADDFFKGLFTTALEDGEIITAVSFPLPAKAGLREIPPSGLALRADRRVRREDQVRRRPRRRHRRIAERRDAGCRDRAGAEGELVGFGAGQRARFPRTA